MDALRFVRALRPLAPATVAPAPPPVSSASAAPPPHLSAVLHAPVTRLCPRGGSGEKAAAEAACGEEARGRRRKMEAEAGKAKEVVEEGKPGNWVLQVLRVQSRWEEDAHAEASGEAMAAAAAGAAAVGDSERCVACGSGGEEEGCVVGDGVEEEEGGFDRASFSRLLRKVSLAETKVYSTMSYLCNIAYMVPKIKPKYLQRYNLQLVTSSVQKKAKAPTPDQCLERKPGDREFVNTGMLFGPSDCEESTFVADAAPESKREYESDQGINPFPVYQVAATAASYLHSRAMGIITFGSGNNSKSDPTIRAIVNGENGEGLTVDEASFVATTNSVTSMVAAKEETKQAVADDLNSSRSCPCEWFICDNNQSSTRYFVVQGSETIASWQANLLFEPIKFEGLNVLVHRGIYEAAKGIYQQMLPYVKSHLGSHGKLARLRFTGHSLGGSLALLVNLMLLIRGEAPASSLLPVITFGAPCIMCGGDYLLRKLGLPKSHVQSITMHRDIVPRAFSCNYPGHVANILKLVNGNFRSHPCLTSQKLLYAPMGKILILQPDEKFSPHHHLLPTGSGLYILGDSSGDSNTPPRVLQDAMSAFFNSPHPLEILGDGGAYGPKGTVYRDHDVNSYLRSVRAVVLKEMKAQREQQRLLWWPIQVHGVLANMNQQQVNLSNVVHGGRETLRQLRRHAPLLVVLLLPAKLLVLGVLSVIRFN